MSQHDLTNTEWFTDGFEFLLAAIDKLTAEVAHWKQVAGTGADIVNKLQARIDELTGFVDDAKAEAVEWERTSQQVAIDRDHWKGVAARRHEIVLEVAKQLDAAQARLTDEESWQQVDSNDR